MPVLCLHHIAANSTSILCEQSLQNDIMQALLGESTMPSGDALPLRTRAEGPAFDDGPFALGGDDKPDRAQPEFVAGQSGRELQDLQVQELRYG